MSAAQELYENGHITYMRTDSVSISNDAIKGIRNTISQSYGNNYLTKQIRMHASKNKNSQEAHEAIRPTGNEPLHPDQLPSSLSPNAKKLYKIIWQRTLASQMSNMQATRMKISALTNLEKEGQAEFVAQGSKIDFDGFQVLYKEDVDEIDEENDEDSNQIFPKINESDTLKISDATSSKHMTCLLYTSPSPRA